MTYSTRNSFYLRLSNRVVLPVYVYLDERHVNWMSDKILQHVLADLRPRILFKLRSDAESLTVGASEQKKASVDTHKGDTYQFCYFVRKTEPHSVVIKSRTYRVTSTHKRLTLETLSARKGGKRKETLFSDTQKKKKRRVESPAEDVNDEDTVSIAADDPSTSVHDSDPSSSEFDVELDIEEEDEKPKPILGLRSVTQPSLLARRAKGAVNKPTGETGDQAEAALPLFLPEELEEPVLPRKETQVNKSYLHHILNEEAASVSEDDMGGMLGFSQVLQHVSDARMGGTNDDDDEDAFMLFGDADDFREL